MALIKQQTKRKKKFKQFWWIHTSEQITRITHQTTKEKRNKFSSP